MIAIDDVANIRNKKLDLLAMLYKDPLLCGQYLFPNHFYMPVARWHKKYIRFLAEGHKYNLIVAPRGHAKTTCTQFYHIMPRILYKQEKYILIISNTYDQATKIIKSLEMELATNEKLIKLFGQLKGDMWREDQFTTTTGVYVQAVGSTQKIRGFKYGETRPTLIYCHKKGTRIRCDEGDILVEQHSTAREYTGDGFQIKICGLPDAETVSINHKYWAKKITSKQKIASKSGIRKWRQEYSKTEAGWVEAKDLTKYHYIGTPIDSVTATPRLIPHGEPAILERDSKGRIVAMGGASIDKFHKWFSDNEFYWFLGLWWGDGSLGGRQISIVVANKDEDTVGKRLGGFLTKYNKSFSKKTAQGCYYVTICDTALANWLKTWKRGNSRKTAPEWIMQLDIEKQKNIIKGYVDADGFIDKRGKCVRVTSVHHEGLMQLKTMLARIGIPSSIRAGVGEGFATFENNGKPYTSKTQKKYDIRFRENSHLLGYEFENQTRYGLKKSFIEDGFLWQKIRDIKPVKDEVFVPITTKDHTYLTDFGLSHNCDDIENDINVKNEDQRDEIIKWFYGAVLPALSVDGKIIITGTILHYDSLLMRLSVDDGWNKLWFSAEVNPDKKISLWKEMKDWDELMKIKQSYYNIGLIDQYNCEYLNDPVPAEAGAFQKQYFRYFTDEDVKLSDLNKAIITDFAFSDNSSSDYNVVMVCGMDGLGKVYVIDYVRFRWNNDTQEIMDAVFQKAEQYGITKVGVETITAQRVMVTIFNAEMKKRNKRLQLVEMKQHRTAKNSRIEAELQSRYKAGDIYHRKWMLELEDELLKFPKAKHDDLVDCLSRVFEILREGKKSSPLKLVLPRQHSVKLYNKYPLVARF